ncbi:MAG TPA: class I SAM-dependent methyltransferase [Chloroflexota bacterium]|nr:class I SAM-dependent methyltransferase [Chloroflexota bacterium]
MSAAEPDRTQHYKEAMRENWTANAVSWRARRQQHAITTRDATEVVVAAARVRPGLRVLDLASGTGEPSLTLAERVGPDGHVTATDLVPEMLAAAEEGARERGLTNITFQQADAEALPFADQTFDVVTCRFGVMFFPNVGQALREVYRVLKPGGRVVLLAQGPLDQNPFFAMAHAAAAKYAPAPPPEPDAPHGLRFADARKLGAALRDAGFREVEADYRAVRWIVPGPPEQVWENHRRNNSQFRKLAATLTPEQAEQVHQDVLAASAPYFDGQQVDFPAVVVLATGVR